MPVPDQIKSKQLRKGNLGSVEQDEFSDIIITILSLEGGSASRQKIIETIHSIYSSQFSKADYELLASLHPPKERWIHNVDWAKRKLVKEGILLPPLKSPYGTWVLSEEISPNNITKI